MHTEYTVNTTGGDESIVSVVQLIELFKYTDQHTYTHTQHTTRTHTRVTVADLLLTTFTISPTKHFFHSLDSDCKNIKS